MSYYGSCRNRFSNEQKVHMRALFQNDPDYAPLKAPDANCITPKKGKVVAHCSSQGDNTPLESLSVQMLDGGSITCSSLTGIDGNYELSVANCQISPGLRKVLPQKNLVAPNINPAYLEVTNGVTAYDLILMSRHIMNLEPLTDPFKLISADVNNSGTLTTFDVVLTRKVLLGSLLDFPAGSWRYVPDMWFSLPSFEDQFSGINNSNGSVGVNPFDVVIADPVTGVIRNYGAGVNIVPNSTSWMDNVWTSTLAGGIGYEFSNYESTWSFTGTKVGDVDCGAIPIPLAGDAPIDHLFMPEGGTSTTISSNTFKNVNIIAHSTIEISSWQFGVSYPSDKIKINETIDGDAGLLLGADNFSNFENTTNNQGKFSALWFSEDGSTVNVNNKKLFSLVIEGKESIPVLENILKPDSKVLPVKFFDAVGNEISSVTLSIQVQSQGSGDGSGERSIEQVKPVPFGVEVSPVPFTSELRFILTTQQAESAEITLFDISGRVVSQEEQFLSSGQNEIYLSELQSLVPGVYAFRIKSNSFSWSGKVIK